MGLGTKSKSTSCHFDFKRLWQRKKLTEFLFSLITFKIFHLLKLSSNWQDDLLLIYFLNGSHLSFAALCMSELSLLISHFADSKENKCLPRFRELIQGSTLLSLPVLRSPQTRNRIQILGKASCWRGTKGRPMSFGGRGVPPSNSGRLSSLWLNLQVGWILNCLNT